VKNLPYDPSRVPLLDKQHDIYKLNSRYAQSIYSLCGYAHVVWLTTEFILVSVALSSWGYMHPYSSLDGRLITGLSPAFNSLVPIYMYTPGWRETLRVVSRLRTARTVTQDQSIQSPVR